MRWAWWQGSRPFSSAARARRSASIRSSSPGCSASSAASRWWACCRRRGAGTPLSLSSSPPRGAAGAGKTPPIVAGMFVVGAVIALAWSSVSQFLIPLRGTREFGLDRAGNSWMLAIPQIVDLVVLLPVGYLADRLGGRVVLGAVCLALGAGTFFVGLGPFPLFVAGGALFGLGLAGWMLPVGVIREHTPLGALGWRTGLYRVGVDARIFVVPLVSRILDRKSVVVGKEW